MITLRDVTGQRRLEQRSPAGVLGRTHRPTQPGVVPRRPQPRHGSRRGVAAVVVLDLDRFRAVNESLGRATGDRVLTAIARRLQTVAGANTLTARLGGDEFAILVDHIEGIDAVDELARRVQASFAQPVLAGVDAVSCSASMGIATTVEASTDHEILRNADLALDAAKAAGPGSWRRYEPSLVEAVRTGPNCARPSAAP